MSDPLQTTLAQLVDQLAERIAQRLIEHERAHQTETAGEERSPWLGIERAAAYLDWPKGRLYKLTAAGAIPHYKHESRLLFHRAELDQWLRQHAHGPNVEER